MQTNFPMIWTRNQITKFSGEVGSQSLNGHPKCLILLRNCFIPTANSLHPRSWTKVPLVLLLKVEVSEANVDLSYVEIVCY